MRDKLIVQRLENGIVVNTKTYKSITEMTRDLEGLHYHNVRERYLYCSGRQKRNLQAFNKSLLNCIRITDNPDDGNPFIKQTHDSPAEVALL